MNDKIEKAAHQAATSPYNDKTQPTLAQIEAGNYAKGHVKIGGLDIAVENPEHSTRSGVDADGKPWSIRMQSHYGYVKATTGSDKEHVDIFIKPGTQEDYDGPVFVVDQKDGDGSFDEHKILLGWPDEARARQGYLANYANGWDGIQGVQRFENPTALKAWLDEGDLTKPAFKGSEMVTKTEGGVEFPKAAYAYTPSDEPSTWKLRLWESPESKETAAQVGRAAAALGKGFRGNKVELPADARGEVIGKIRAAWKRVNKDKADDEMPEVLKASEPGLGDVHVPSTSWGNGKKKPKSRFYLSHLLSQMTPHFSKEQLHEMVKKARAHAGGKSRIKVDNTGAVSFCDMDDQPFDPWAQWPEMQQMQDDEALEPYISVQFEKSDPRVKYQDAKSANERCGMCANFDEDDGNCTLVEGSIDPNKYCLLFQAEQGTMELREWGFNLADICADDHGWRLFNEYDFAEPPEWIPLLPKPGVFQHEEYGKLNITKERNERFVANVKKRVYQGKLPINAEHSDSDEGAFGWVTDARMNEDNSVDGKAEWSDLGEHAIRNNRFAYISPEWKDKWTNKRTGETHSDVLLGAALTVRPWFKDDSLRPLIASEGRIQAYSEQRSTGGDTPIIVFTAATPISDRQRSKKMEDSQKIGMTEEQAQKFGELETQVRQLTEQGKEKDSAITRLTEENKAASERISVMEKQRRIKRFTDIVTGKDSANSRAFIGDKEFHVGMLMTLTEHNNDDENAEPVKKYIEQQRAVSEQVHSGELFKEKGSDREGQGEDNEDAEDKLDKIAKKMMEDDEDMTYAQAYAKAVEKNPKLYTEYADSRRRQGMRAN